MTVDDHGIEAIRKSAEELTPGSKAEYRIKTRVTSIDQIGFVVSSANSTTTPLSAGATFTGTGEDIQDYNNIVINIAGAPSVAAATFYFEFSPDNINWDVSVPYTLTGPTAFVPLPLVSVLRYFRIRYVNGATPLTQLRITTNLYYAYPGDLTRVLNQTIDENEPVKNVRAFIGGKSPDGPYTNLPATGEVASQSTMATLAGGATFNSSGTIIEMGGYVAVSVTIKSDVASAANGLVFHWYDDPDGTNELKPSTFTYGSAGSGVAVQVPRQGPYLRITYTNGASAQSYFLMASRLFVTAPPSDVLAISETITANTAAQVVKANIVGLQENGTYANVGLSNTGSVKVAITDRPSEVRSRVRKEFAIFRTSLTGSNTTLYTVTGGKTLYLTSFIASFINNANAIGEWRIRDGSTDKLGFVSGEKAVGASAPSQATGPNLPEPIPFTTAVNAYEITGDIQVSFYGIGYEE